MEKEIAELKTRVDEMTSTMVDMASIIAELKLESIQPKVCILIRNICNYCSVFEIHLFIVINNLFLYFRRRVNQLELE